MRRIIQAAKGIHHHFLLVPIAYAGLTLLACRDEFYHSIQLTIVNNTDHKVELNFYRNGDAIMEQIISLKSQEVKLLQKDSDLGEGLPLSFFSFLYFDNYVPPIDSLNGIFDDSVFATHYLQYKQSPILMVYHLKATRTFSIERRGNKKFF
ncbi:MAG: hypothetical protein ACOYXT_02065 [Bacteroidota bacterium]